MANSQQQATEKLFLRVDELSTAISNLAEDPKVSLDQARDLISELLEETRVSLEELRVADEELAEQNEELIKSRLMLESERQHYQDLFTLAPVGYVLSDKEGVIRESNEAAARLLNVRLDYLVGKPLAIFVPESDRTNFRHWLLTSNIADKVSVRKLQLRPRHSPEIRDIAVTLTQMADPIERPHDVQFRWLLNDVTEQKKADAAEREQFFHDTFERAGVGIAHADRNGHYLRVNQKICDLLGYTREELLQLTSLDVSVMDDFDTYNEALQQLVQGKIDSLSLEKRYRRKNGQMIWAHLTASTVHDADGSYLYTIEVLNDITESKRLIAAELEQRRLTEAVRKNSAILTSTLNYADILDQIVITTSLIVPYEGASIWLVKPNSLDPYIERGWGDIAKIIPAFEKSLHDLHVPDTGENLFQRLETTPTPVILSDLRGKLSSKKSDNLYNIQSLIILPIIARDAVIGYMEMHSSSPNFFTNQHSEHLQIFASQAAVAIQNARAYKQGQELAALEERHRLARDLHDAVTQTLFTSSIISEALLRTDRSKLDLVWQHLDTLHMLNRSALAEMRTLLIELRPEYLLKLPLHAQLKQLIDAMKSRKQIDIHLTVNENTKEVIPTEVQIVLYRITQEALNNIVKHSNASMVEVVFNNEPDQVMLSITDNGVGFNMLGKNGTVSMGIANMQERANSIHSQLHISSSIGKGTQIRLSWLRSAEREYDSRS
jgi:two-component system nitrate/nitrite sensor histidine kinase NarX